jgi:hypothetical protein
MIDITDNIVAYLLKARTVEPEKQSLLGNGCVTRNNGMPVGRVLFVQTMYRPDCPDREIERQPK